MAETFLQRQQRVKGGAQQSNAGAGPTFGKPTSAAQSYDNYQYQDSTAPVATPPSGAQNVQPAGQKPAYNAGPTAAGGANQPGATPGFNPGTAQYGGINPSANLPNGGQAPSTDIRASGIGQSFDRSQAGGFVGYGDRQRTQDPNSVESRLARGEITAEQAQREVDATGVNSTGMNQQFGSASSANSGQQTYANVQQQQAAKVQQWTSKFGRAPNQQQLNRIAAKIGAPAGPNGTYTPEQEAAADAEAEVIARELGWNGPAAPPAPATTPAPFPNPQEGAPGHQGRVAVEPTSTYTANQLDPYQRQNTGNVGAMNTALMERILANPESLPPQVIAQMKARAKQSGVAMAGQLQGEGAATLAGRGFSGTGGTQQGYQADVNRSLVDSILNSNRDIDITAATTNFNDRLNASGAGSDFLNSATSRGVAESGAEVQRFGANESARQGEDASRFRNDEFRYGQMRDDRNSNLAEFLGKSGVDLDNRRMDETRRQFNQTFGFDILKFLEDNKRFGMTFGEGQRQHNNNLGFNYTQLGQQGQDSLRDWLTRAYGG